MISHTLPYLVMIFKLKNFNNIQNFGNNLHSLPQKNNLSLLRSSKKSPQNFLQTFCSYGTIFPEVKLLKNFKQTLSTLWQTWKTLCYKNFTKNFALLRKTNSVNLHGLCPIYYWLQNTQQCKTIQNSTSKYNH